MRLTASAFVLAGGASTRMGMDKALMPFGGVALVEHALAMLRRCGLSPSIVAARPDLQHYAPVIADRRTGCGPLSGIEAGLLASETDLAVFIPVDMPLLPAALVHLLLSRAQRTGSLVTLPRSLGIPQPLCAVYHRALLPAITRALDQGDYKVMRVMQQAATGRSNRASLPPDIFNLETVLAAGASFDGWPPVPGRALINCNTPGDIARIY